MSNPPQNTDPASDAAATSAGAKTVRPALSPPLEKPQDAEADTNEDFIRRLLGDDPDHPILRVNQAFKTAMRADDPDSIIMRAAYEAGISLRRLAHEKKIDLNGPRWIEPEELHPHAENLTAIFNEISLSSDYLAWQHERTHLLVKLLCGQKMFLGMMESWHRAAPAMLELYAGWISRQQQEVFSNGIVKPCRVDIDLYSKPREIIDGHARLVLGTHHRPGAGRDEPHDIGLNYHEDTRFHVAAQAMNVIHHENDHATQWTLASAFVLGTLPANHPLAREARLFLMAFGEQSSYIPAVKAAYRAHPLELDTFGQSERFVNILRRRLHTHGIDIDYDAKAAPVALLTYQPA